MRVPKEVELLKAQRPKVIQCEKCKNFVTDQDSRGMVQRGKRWFWIGPKRDYCAIICDYCRHIKGWESPEEQE